MARTGGITVGRLTNGQQAAFDLLAGAALFLDGPGDLQAHALDRRDLPGDLLQRAGGNLAAALCLALRDAGEPQPRVQALVYPALGDEATDSRVECADAPLLSAADMRVCIDAYLPDPLQRHRPLALPLRAHDFAGLAPAFVGVAEFDPLRDDGRRYAERLRRDGVEVDYFPGPGLVHGCLRARELAEVNRLYEALFEALARRLD